MHIAVIGAGPSGLSAFSSLCENDQFSVSIFDRGLLVKDRHHDRSSELGSGFGGAGLYSDGKFSFYPAGSHFYKTADPEILKDSYKWLEKKLAEVSIEYVSYKSFQKLWNTSPSFSSSKQTSKKYFSSYGSLHQRQKLIENFERIIPAKSAFPKHDVVHIAKTTTGKFILLIKDLINNVLFEKYFDIVILATGRFGSLDSLGFDLPVVPLRYELGIRLETSHLSPFFNSSSLDIKKIWTDDDDLEIRTFCTCRKGEVTCIPYKNSAAISGRSDGPKTDYSNLGFLIRFQGKNWEKGESLWRKICEDENIRKGHCYWQKTSDFFYSIEKRFQTDFPLPSFVKKAAKLHPISVENRAWSPKENFIPWDLTEILGYDFSLLFAQKLLEKMIYQHPEFYQEGVIFFPCIEGIGTYPALSENLRSRREEGLFFVGDNCGTFRGLVPALLSGSYVGKTISKTFR